MYAISAAATGLSPIVYKPAKETTHRFICSCESTALTAPQCLSDARMCETTQFGTERAQKALVWLAQCSSTSKDILETDYLAEFA